ncbi:MAG: FHA domain-containing protein, partial [Verrucomicrobiota bacterium]
MPVFLKPLTENADLAGSFEIPVGAGSYSVGRLSDSDLPIHHDSVSGLHARIESTGLNGIDLVDCGSSNGTFVNGEKIQRCELKTGDVVRFASAKFRVEESEGAPGLDWEKEQSRYESEIELLKNQLARETAAAEERIEKLSRELSDFRQSDLEKDKQLATLQFEISQRDSLLQQAEEKHRIVEEERVQWQSIFAQNEAETAEVKSALTVSEGHSQTLTEKLETLTRAVREMGDEWQNDWSYWLDFSDKGSDELPNEMAGLTRLEKLRQGIRGQLDLIEPLWKEYGDEVGKELKSRCEALEKSGAQLDRERSKKQKEL